MKKICYSIIDKEKDMNKLIWVFGACALIVLGSCKGDKSEIRISSGVSVNDDNPDYGDDIKLIVDTCNYSYDLSQYIVTKLHDSVPDIKIIGVSFLVDDIGKGLVIESSENNSFNVYMYDSGMIYGIKNNSTGEYVYAVYE